MTPHQGSGRGATARMEGVDAGFLYLETPTVHMHTLKIAVLEPDPLLTYDTFVAGLLSRLHQMPPMRRRVVPVPFALNHPVWVTMRRVDVDHHVRHQRVPGAGTMRDLERLVGEIASTPLDRAHPLWELHYCEGLDGGRVAIVGKIDHALADGGAANHLLAHMTDFRSADPLPPPVDPVPDLDHVPSRRTLVRDALVDGVRQVPTLPPLLLRTLRAATSVVRHRRTSTTSVPLPVVHSPQVPWTAPLTARRSFATVTLPLPDLKRVRTKHEGVTLNDLVLAVVSGALRRWLAENGQVPRVSLTAGVPVGVEEAGAAPRLGGNRVSNMFTTLATDVDDPEERLQVIARTTSEAKEVLKRWGPRMMLDWTQFAPPGPFAAVVRAYSRLRAASWHPSPFSVIVSNVPGPRERVTIGAARVAELYSVGPLVDGIGLNVTVWSYVDRMAFSLLSCPDLLPDVDRLASFLPDALAELDREHGRRDASRAGA